MPNPRIKYDKRGHAYYDYGWGGKVQDFAAGFMQGMEIAQNLKDKEEARRLMRKRERDTYDKLSPEQQEDFIRKAPAQDLIDLGLADPKAKGEEPAGPVEPGTKPMKKQRFGELQVPGEVTLRPKVIRDKTLVEKGADAQAEAVVRNAVRGADLAYEIQLKQNQAYDLQIRQGEFNLSKDVEDKATKESYLKSGNPFLIAVAMGRPVAEVHEQQLREKFPELAFREDQIKFNMGPHARALGEARFRDEADKKYPNPGDAKKWTEAMVAAAYEGDYTKMRNLPPSMKTYASQQLSIQYENLAINKAQVLQAEQHFLAEQSKQLVGASGGILNMDTAQQWLKKTMYGEKVSPMSPQATKQVEQWQTTLEGSRQAASATAYYELQEKRGRAAREAREGLRSTVATLLNMHKEELGGKGLEQQMLAIKDELVKQELAALGLNPVGPEGSFWSEVIWNTAKTTMGVGQLGIAVAADEATSQASLGGRIVQDVIPQSLRTAFNKYAQDASTMYGKVGTQLSDSAEYVTNPEGKSIDWALSGTKLGNQIRAMYEHTPGVRVVFEENLKAKQSSLKVEAEASTDPIIIADRVKKIEEISEILRGMGVK